CSADSSFHNCLYSAASEIGGCQNNACLFRPFTFENKSARIKSSRHDKCGVRLSIMESSGLHGIPCFRIAVLPEAPHGFVGQGNQRASCKYSAHFQPVVTFPANGRYNGMNHTIRKTDDIICFAPLHLGRLVTKAVL